MGGQSTKEVKEEVIIAQNAAAGNNDNIQELRAQVSTTYMIVGIILILLLIGCAVAAYKCYRRFHQKWMRREIATYAGRRFTPIFRRREPVFPTRTGEEV